jgi:precorrin-6A/cobalt-precorrin-6A reductase
MWVLVYLLLSISLDLPISTSDVMKRLLILGGTGDAAQLAAEAVNLPKLEVISTLAGRTTSPAPVASTVRIGGFGGKAGLVEYLRETNIDLLIDATHPFAAQISANAAQAATEVGIPWLMLIRPCWEKLPEDDWIEVESISAAVAAIPAKAERIFLTIGRQQLAPFASLTDRWFLMRSIDPPAPDILLPPGKLLLDRGPFSLTQERQLLQDNRIQSIVSKNSGGDATYAKVIAAREMNIPIVMMQRPIAPAGDKVVDVSGAIDWLRDRLLD